MSLMVHIYLFAFILTSNLLYIADWMMEYSTSNLIFKFSSTKRMNLHYDFLTSKQYKH